MKTDYYIAGIKLVLNPFMEEGVILLAPESYKELTEALQRERDRNMANSYVVWPGRLPDDLAH